MPLISLTVSIRFKSASYSEKIYVAKIKSISSQSLVLRLMSKKRILLKKKSECELSIQYENQIHIFKGKLDLLKETLRNQYVVFEIAHTLQEKWQSLLGQARKNQHIEICKGPVEASDEIKAGFDDFFLEPSGLFQLDPQDCDLSVNFLSTRFSYPIMITGMTGGVDKGALINQRLASLAVQHNIPMGVGSQRLAIEEPKYESIFKLKHLFPDLFLIGNIGFAQLATASDPVTLCKKVVNMIEADALAIHFNGLQEMIQSEGDRSFKNALKALTLVCEKLHVPVIVKEVGSGFCASDVTRLISSGVSAVDLGGKGGTSWGYIEGLRSSDSVTKRLGENFRNWGLPTAHNLYAIRQVHPDFSISATGGIRTPIHIAKALALGADMVGIGLPFFRAALLSEKNLHDEWDYFAKGLLIAMMATGNTRIKDLRLSLRKNGL